MKNIPSTWLVLTPTVTLALVISGCVSTTLQLAQIIPLASMPRAGEPRANPPPFCALT